MAQKQITIFLLCIATVYAASLPNVSDEDFSAEIEMEETPSKLDSAVDKNGQITEYDPISPSFIITEDVQSNGFQMGKSLVQGLLGLLQIVRQMSMSQEGLKNVSFLVANMVSIFAGQYYETLKKLMPMFSGMVTAILETLR